MPGIEVNSPEGTYVLFANIEKTGRSSEEMTAYLLKEARVSVVPRLTPMVWPEELKDM